MSEGAEPWRRLLGKGGEAWSARPDSTNPAPVVVGDLFAGLRGASSPPGSGDGEGTRVGVGVERTLD